MPRSCRRGMARAGLVLLLALVSFAAMAPAHAHLKLASSDPTDGGVLRDPAAGILLTFTRPAAPQASRFGLFDQTGADLESTATTRDGGTTWRVAPVEPMPAGSYGLRWRVAAGDAHAMTGTVTFSVPAPAPGATDSSSGGTGAGPTTEPSQPAPLESDEPSAAVAAGGTLTDPAAAPSRLWDVAAVLARWVSFGGVFVGVGALVVTVTTLVGSRGDIRLSEQVIRLAAGTAAAGAMIEALCLLAIIGTSTPLAPAAAAGLRLLGGLGLVAAGGLSARRTGGRRGHDVPTLAAPEASPSGSRTAQLVLTPPVVTGRVRGTPLHPIGAVLACSLMLVAFLLDGHTAIIAPWPLIATATLAHTLAASVWVGGVILLAVLLWKRARAGVPTGAGELAVRFSVPATASVVAAGLAGTALAFLIIDSPDDLLGTAWGRVLLAKLALVAVVAVIGYANNRYALPALDAWRPGTARLLRRTVAAEAAVMTAVLLVTAVLVASQT